MKKKVMAITILIIVFLFICSIQVNATTITATKSREGEKVTIQVKSDVSLGAYVVELVNEDGLTFVTSTAPQSATGVGGKRIAASSTTGINNLVTYELKVPTSLVDKTYHVEIKCTAMETPELKPVEDHTIVVDVFVPKEGSSTGIKGDINDSGSVTSYDAYLLLEIVAAGGPYTAEEIAKYDMTGDGKVTAYDSYKILQYVSGEIPEL